MDAIDFRIILIYKVKQNTHRGDFANPKTKWFLDKEQAETYVNDFEAAIKNRRFYGHGGHVYAELFEEYALYDVRSDRYYSLGPFLKIEIGKPGGKYIPPNKRGGDGE